MSVKINLRPKLNPIERTQVPLKSCVMNFQNNLPFMGSAHFYVAMTRCFKRFHYFNFERGFLKNKIYF